MKVIILIAVMAISVYMAFIRVSVLKERLEKSKKMLLLSEKIRKNYLTEMLSPISVCRELCGGEIHTKAQAIEAIKSEFAGVRGEDEFTERFSKLFTASADELDDICSSLNECASNGYRSVAAEYEKNKDLVYIIYPGIVGIVSIIIM